MPTFSMAADPVHHLSGGPTHFENLSSEFMKMSFLRQYEDLIIRCHDKTTFSVNKLVLVESSKLLKKIFSAPEFELLHVFTQDLICPDFDSDALKHVINLVYFGKTTIR
jgi:BTB/POZ domain